MTIFELRDLADIIARACLVMPDSDAMDLKVDMLGYIQRQRPDTTREQWFELIEDAPV